MSNADLLNPLKYGLFAFQLTSHKLLRWLVPLFLLLMLLSSAAGAMEKEYFLLIFYVQAAGYLLALIAFLSKRACEISPMRLFRYAFISNVGILMAWLRFLQGKRIVYWEPSKR
jgi:hypothetical protein